MNYFNSDVDLGLPGAMDMNTGFSGGNPYSSSFGGSAPSWSDMHKSGMLDKPFYSSGADSGFSGAFSKNFDGALNFLKSKVAKEKEKEKDDPYKPINLGGAGGSMVTPLKGGKYVLAHQNPTATIIPAQPDSGGGFGLGDAFKIGSMFVPGPVGTAMKVGSMLV